MRTLLRHKAVLTRSAISGGSSIRAIREMSIGDVLARRGLELVSRAAVYAGDDAPLNEYAARNHAELFAVATEAFFCKSVVSASSFPSSISSSADSSATIPNDSS